MQKQNKTNKKAIQFTNGMSKFDTSGSGYSENNVDYIVSAQSPSSSLSAFGSKSSTLE